MKMRVGMEASGHARWFGHGAHSIPEWRSKFFHLAMRRGRKIAKVATARRLAVRKYWMWRKGWDYEQLKKSVRTRESPQSPERVLPRQLLRPNRSRNAIPGSQSRRPQCSCRRLESRKLYASGASTTS